jgi:hypothetical protein
VFILVELGGIFSDVFILDDLADILWGESGAIAGDFVDVFIPEGVRGGNTARRGKRTGRGEREAQRTRVIVAAVTLVFIIKITECQQLFTM